MRELAVVRRLKRRLGVRLRSALAAAVVVVVASLLCGGVLLVTARRVLLNTITAAATDRATQVVTALRGGDDLTALLRPSAPERTVVQVVDTAGGVAAASEALAGQAPISALRPAAGRRLTEQQRLTFAHNDLFEVVAVGVNTAAGLQTVLVGSSLDTFDDGTEAVIAAMLVGLPLLAVVVGAATFFFVGRTLHPVEDMRAQAASITSRNLHTRLPVPAADDEVAALASTMNTMLDRIEAASAAQRRFVADASHELRSPLATVQANADLLDGAGLDEAPARSVARIRRESARMARLVEDLLLLARVDDDGLRVRREDVDLDDLAYAERERIAVQHPRLTVRADIEPVRVTGDADALQRVLRNLVDNAARHAAGTVTLTVRVVDGAAEVRVSNDGPPIPEDDRERIFDRFVRLDDSRSRAAGGTGLGLPIARDIVTAHGGALTVDDLDVGAAMRISLPLPGGND
ncbi:ATP-binding protein [Amorphoplanes nipponensis]|uniref:histidine kinase n=1 Tax=Actinoplanes nipponensis TaxID=135950 RepID=A0A919JIE2_9ACTN|nr:HAMP domain-containing sensor histidine kinase [Actinoplanes nipponensis]GIE51614.1 two-component sensor histidine kinase [Actinoplanes nipponensis]